MADRKASPENTDPISGSDPQDAPPASVAREASNTEKQAEEHIEDAPSSDSNDSAPDLHKKGALGFIQQQHIIPTTGNVMPTGKWEYIFFCVYCRSWTATPNPKMVHPLTMAMTDFSNNGAREYPRQFQNHVKSYIQTTGTNHGPFSDWWQRRRLATGSHRSGFPRQDRPLGRPASQL